MLYTVDHDETCSSNDIVNAMSKSCGSELLPDNKRVYAHVNHDTEQRM